MTEKPKCTIDSVAVAEEMFPAAGRLLKKGMKIQSIN